MAITHTITSVLSGAAVGLSGSLSVESDFEQHPEVALDASAAEVEVSLVFPVAKLKSFFYICDQNTTLKTNSSGAPDDTFTIPANKPFPWNTAMLTDNPFAGDVAKVFITNNSAVPATAKIVTLSDGTPGS